MPEEDPSRYRLPRTVVPVRYELTLEPDLDAATFAGSEAVTVDVREPVDQVVLNAVELEIDQAWLEGDGTRLDATVALDPDTERAHLNLSDRAAPGRWTLCLRFRGVLNDKLHGFYRSTFTAEDGGEQVLATTQFEATDARRAFPCWDEPDLKAIFAVTLIVDEPLTALSNAAVVADEPTGEGRRRVCFADTMVMSTYLVAFIVGRLEVTEAVDVDGTPLRVAHVPGKGHLADYALEVGAFALRWFAAYYGIPYPGDKVDLVAIPDFASGAMENLGCVTFREVLLLVEEGQVTQPELQNVADVIAHELAHMWFGDLVTMRWWNGIWLNEAFATFMEMLATDAFRPEWERWVSFGLSRSAAMEVDGLASTRPIEFPVVSPEDAEGMFDVLTYEKGAAVVRMLEQYLGGDAFRDGIRGYLQAHRYANTETTDLWDAIEAATGQPTRRIMDSWIFQGGYPVVDVAVDADGRVLRLSQRPFRYQADGESDGSVDGDSPARWAVPVIVGHGSDGAARLDKVLLDGDVLEIDLATPADWVLVNAGGSGFYRVRYQGDLVERLLGRSGPSLSAIERYGVVDDTWASVRAGDLPAAAFLDLARRFADEADPSVWQRIVAALGSLDRILDSEGRQRFQAYVRGLAGPAWHRLGEPAAGDGESDRTRELRATLFSALGSLGGDDTVRQRAASLHQAYLGDPESVEPNLAAAAMAVLADAGGRATFETFLDRYRQASTPQEEQRYLYALGDFPDDDLVERALALSLSDDVRTQNGPFLLRRALTNRVQGPRAWRFLRDRWDDVNERFPSNSIVRMVDGVRALSQPEVADDVLAFFGEHEIPQSARTLAQVLEQLRVNVALRQRERDRLADALP